MDEVKFIKEFMSLTACSEAFARSVYMHSVALGGAQASAEATEAQSVPAAEGEEKSPATPSPAG
jgi:hypothetical protein